MKVPFLILSGSVMDNLCTFAASKLKRDNVQTSIKQGKINQVPSLEQGGLCYVLQFGL